MYVYVYVYVVVWCVVLVVVGVGFCWSIPNWFLLLLSCTVYVCIVCAYVCAVLCCACDLGEKGKERGEDR